MYNFFNQPWHYRLIHVKSTYLSFRMDNNLLFKNSCVVKFIWSKFFSFYTREVILYVQIMAYVRRITLHITGTEVWVLCLFLEGPNMKLLCRDCIKLQILSIVCVHLLKTDTEYWIYSSIFHLWCGQLIILYIWDIGIYIVECVKIFYKCWRLNILLLNIYIYVYWNRNPST